MKTALTILTGITVFVGWRFHHAWRTAWDADAADYEMYAARQ